MENLQAKLYKVRVVPFVPKAQVNQETGKPEQKPAVYIRTTNPSEKALAVKDADGNQVFGKQKFMQLEIFEQDENNRLSGDVKAFTVNIFERTHRLLFDVISEMVTDESQYTEMKTSSKARVLKDNLPGLVRRRTCGSYYATRIAKDGSTKILMQNTKNKDGNFNPEPVVMDYVSYFLFKNEVNNDDDEIRYRQETQRAYINRPKGASSVAEDDARIEAEQAEETAATTEAAPQEEVK
jgi:hypothetical protein